MKKTFLTIATLLLVSTTSLSFAQTTNTEIQDAYNYAYSIGITTQGSIDSANMYGSLIRSHMAKMMVNYAKNVLGQTPDFLLSCNFSDIANETAELKGYIIEACQMGLMGVGISKFSPDDLVTRAQFGTVISRALYGDLYNDGTPYYLYHLQALQEDGIMTNISRPDSSEVRGYVMLMMMRAGGKVEAIASQCETQENQLLCLIESADCPTECQTSNEIIDQTGTLNIASTTIAPGTLPLGTKYLGSLKFTATDHDITLKSLSFQKIGSVLGWIEDNGVKIANIQSVSTDATITISFSPRVIISQGEPKILSIFIEDTEGNNQGLTLSNATSISSSASSLKGSFPYKMVK